MKLDEAALLPPSVSSPSMKRSASLPKHFKLSPKKGAREEEQKEERGRSSPSKKPLKRSSSVRIRREDKLDD